MKKKIIYWVFTGLISAWMLLQSFMFIFNSDSVGELFTSLGMPTSIIIPLGVAKFLAVIAIVSGKSVMQKKLAYAGLAVDFILATGSLYGRRWRLANAFDSVCNPYRILCVQQ